MDDETLVEKTKEFVIDTFEESLLPKTIVQGMIRHLFQTREYLLDLTQDSQRNTTPLEIAALLHGIERGFRKRSKYNRLFKGKTHEEKSAIVADRFLKKKRASKKLRKKVKSLILKHETAPTKESKILREADNLSFLENTLPIWFEARLWMGEPREDIVKECKEKVEKKFKQIKSKKGKELVKPYYKKWTEWLQQKEEEYSG